MVGLFSFVMFVLLLASLARSSVLYDRLDKSKLSLQVSEDACGYWQSECERIIAQRDEYRTENERLKKAASKLIMRVAEDFGKEVTKPQGNLGSCYPHSTTKQAS